MTDNKDLYSVEHNWKYWLGSVTVTKQVVSCCKPRESHTNISAGVVDTVSVASTYVDCYYGE